MWLRHTFVDTFVWVELEVTRRNQTPFVASLIFVVCLAPTL